MKNLLSISFALAAALSVSGQVNVQKGGSAGANNITADLNVATGRTLTIASGGTLTTASGSTLTVQSGTTWTSAANLAITATTTTTSITTGALTLGAGGFGFAFGGDGKLMNSSAPTAANATQWLLSTSFTPATNSASAMTNILSTVNFAGSNQNGGPQAIYGLVNVSNINAASGTATSPTSALVGDLRTSSAGVGTAMSALKLFLDHGSSGTVTSMYGIYLADLTSAGGGTLTNTYQIYLGDITAGVQTNQAYGIFQSDANARNRFTGTIEVGAGGQLNAATSAYGAGTAYSLTNSSAAVDFGTTDPSITITAAGTYTISGQVNLLYNAATFAANQTVTLKFRRTNNTPADLTSGTISTTTAVITTLTFTYGVFQIPSVSYTTTNTNDVITIFADVSAVPGAGSLDAVAVGTFIRAKRDF